MLLSWVNTKLRDEASSFSSLCEEYELDMEQIEAAQAEVYEAGLEFTKQRWRYYYGAKEQ